MDNFSDSSTLREYNTGTVRLSTAFRSNLNDKHTDCTLDFTSTNSIMTNVAKIDITSVNICNNFNNIASYNNQFILQSYPNGGVLAEYLITVPPGYYTATQLAAELETLIQAKPNNSATTVVFDTNLRRLVFNTNTANAIGLAIGVQATNFYNNNFLYIIGAEPSGQPLATLNVLPNQPMLNGATTVFLCSNKLAGTKSVKNVALSEATPRTIRSTSSSELIAINITSAYGVYTSYYNNGSNRGVYVYSNRMLLDSIDFQLRDDSGNVLEQGSNNTPIFVSMKVYY